MASRRIEAVQVVFYRFCVFAALCGLGGYVLETYAKERAIRAGTYHPGLEGGALFMSALGVLFFILAIALRPAKIRFRRRRVAARARVASRSSSSIEETP